MERSIIYYADYEFGADYAHKMCNNDLVVKADFDILSITAIVFCCLGDTSNIFPLIETIIPINGQIIAYT